MRESLYAAATGDRMSWHLQTPDGGSPNLLANIIAECGAAQKGGAAFAFASAQGVKLLSAEPIFSKFLKAGEFTVIVGLDAITDTRALDELRKLSKSHPNFKPKLFLHSTAGSIFHPKTMWLKTAKGGVIITGSGNLTSGGLKSNWEATAVQIMTAAEMAETEKSWDAWLKTHKKEIVDLDNEKAIEKAKANKVVRSKIKKALKKSDKAEEPTEEEIDAVEEVIEDIEEEFALNPVLIAEVPKSGNRWQQINFDLKSYQDYFGVTMAGTRYVRFYEVRPDGSLGSREDRQSVSVVSRNFRFEVGAASGRDYPTEGHPILVFEKTDENTFHYVLLMPGTDEHELIQSYLDDNFMRTTNTKLRVQITAGELKKVWPEAPFFL
ncbi:phospholipase D family protein [Bradyrhizobium elkanii]